MGKNFNKDKFFYGYKAEMVFHETFPEAKKLVNSADYSLNDYLIEIGRSRVLESQIIVYFRKLYYNVKHEYKKKDMNPERFLELIKNDKKAFLVSPDKFIFIYFTKNLKYFTAFDYQKLLNSELKRKIDGEYYFDVKGNGLRKTKNLYKIISKKIGYEKESNKISAEDFGVFMQ